MRHFFPADLDLLIIYRVRSFREQHHQSSSYWCPHCPDSSKLLNAWWTLAQVTADIVNRYTKHLHISIVTVSTALVFIEAI